MRYHCWLIKYTLSKPRGRRNPSGMVKGVLKVRLKVPQSPKKFARYARSKKSRFMYGTPKWCSYSRRDPQDRAKSPTPSMIHLLVSTGPSMGRRPEQCTTFTCVCIISVRRIIHDAPLKPPKCPFAHPCYRVREHDPEVNRCLDGRD